MVWLGLAAAPSAAPNLRQEADERTRPQDHQPPVLRRMPEFSLTDHLSRTFGTHQLLGKAWIADFIRTRDPQAASQTAALAKLQKELKRRPGWADTRLVTFTADPERDSPEVLRSHATAAGVDWEQWSFLTGSRDVLERVHSGFAGTAPAHSGKWMLVDPQGHVRGFYDGNAAGQREALKRDVLTTLQERLLWQEFPWLEERRQAQLESAGGIQVLHDFSFEDRVGESGITFRNRIVDDAGRSFIFAHYDHGNGLAIADVDGDGRHDIYFVSQAGSNELWKNLGGGRFENITERAGVGVKERIGVTASFADIDNDGDADLYVTTVRGGNVLFENDGKGVFKDISVESGLGYKGHSSAAVFFDYDRDGRLDLFLVNVGIYTTDEIRTVVHDSFTGTDRATYTYFRSTPDAFNRHLNDALSEPSILYRNQGGNRFVDVTVQAGLQDTSWSGDASPLDANNDGWPDLYLANMQGHDQYYENVEGRRFVKKSRRLFPATPWGTMGIKVFDFENDGRLDLYLTDMHTDMWKHLDPFSEKEKIPFPEEIAEKQMLATDGNHVWGNAFFRNQGDGAFNEMSDRFNAENYWPWGLSVGDLNADGFDDAFITSCMNYGYRYGINSLLLNDRGRRFVDSEFILGVEPRRGGRTLIPWFELDVLGADKDHELVKKARARGARVTRVVAWGAIGSRSSVIFDLDDDGDLDIVTNDFNSEPMVLVSDLADRKRIHFLKVNLTGTRSNRDGLGAWVTVRAGSATYTKVQDGQSGYLSQSRWPLYFGLGEAGKVDQVEVLWPSGQQQVLPGPIPAGSELNVTEP
ncbi:MAG: FG-GAP-like repeat-containing protein [Acidobacteriota bacterium]|nr:FG-GAP-like repeat-containing protein [Acidobacteriota bacterium]